MLSLRARVLREALGCVRRTVDAHIAGRGWAPAAMALEAGRALLRHPAAAELTAVGDDEWLAACRALAAREVEFGPMLPAPFDADHFAHAVDALLSNLWRSAEMHLERERPHDAQRPTIH